MTVRKRKEKKPVNFLDVPFPVEKRFGKTVYQRLHTFPISKATLSAYEKKLEQTHTMKIIPVISISGQKEYMVYIRKTKKTMRK